jgi:hypothetical protein
MYVCEPDMTYIFQQRKKISHCLFRSRVSENIFSPFFKEAVLADRHALGFDSKGLIAC